MQRCAKEGTNSVQQGVAKEALYIPTSQRFRCMVTQWFQGYPEGCKDIDPNLSALNLPVHVFWGEQDAFLTANNAERLHARLPKSALTIFKNCGHFCYQDKSTEFTEVVRSWVNGGHDLG